MEVFKDGDVPVLILTNNIDEIMLKQVANYKNLTFVNVEGSYEEIQHDIKPK